jgi:hypothetical protein
MARLQQQVSAVQCLPMLQVSAVQCSPTSISTPFLIYNTTVCIVEFFFFFTNINTHY